MPFLVGNDECAIGIQANSISGAKTVRQNVRLAAILANSQQRPVVWHERCFCVARRLGVVKIPLLIGLQSHRELMKVIGDLMVAIKALVEICFTIAVEVIQDANLIATRNINASINNPHAKWLEKSRSNSLPSQFHRDGIVFIQPRQTGNFPDIPVPITDGHRVTVVKEIESRQSNTCQPRIV